MTVQSVNGDGADRPDKVVEFFRHFGLGMDRGHNGHATAECPFCGKEKFSVAVEGPKKGLWDCKVCGKDGNPLTFARQLWDASDAATKDYSELSEDRGILFPETLMSWGLAKSVVNGVWLATGYDGAGRVCQVYRYESAERGKKPSLIPSAKEVVGNGVGLFGLNLFDPKKPEVYVCEGIWDAAALWEVLRTTRRTEDGRLIATASEASSLLADVNVLGVPGANLFQDPWLHLFAGKKVTFLYDNDHPKTLDNGTVVDGAGLAGVKKAAGKLALAEQPPASVHWLSWGEDGPDESLPSGYDVRDLLLSQGPDAGARRAALSDLLARTVPIPGEWTKGLARRGKHGSVEVECVDCKSWKTLQNAWRKAMKWSPGLDRALSVMLASIVSVKAVGDQLWVKVVSPPSTGKSVLCEALSVNKQYVLAKSTIRGFHSGFQSDAEGKEDNSLIAVVRDKTLVTKDGDSLLTAPNRDQILAEARDLYDRTARSHYRNKMSRDHEGVDMTWILCGTSSLRSLDSSELGERFLDVVIMDKIVPEEEDEILERVASKAVRNVATVSNGTVESVFDPDMLAAMQLTGGYVSFLRENAGDLLARVEMPRDALRLCIACGKFVAYLRARQSKGQEEVTEREFSARLVSQHVRLAMCLAVVLGRRVVDGEVLSRVRQVALDTARGRSLDTCRELRRHDRAEGTTVGSLAVMTGHGDAKERTLLGFLRKIGVAERVDPSELPKDKRSHVRWRLTETLENLFNEVDF